MERSNNLFASTKLFSQLAQYQITFNRLKFGFGNEDLTHFDEINFF